jgi:hypothetical protein
LAKAKEKVDGAVALAMAIGVAAGSGRQASVYEERPQPNICMPAPGRHQIVQKLPKRPRAPLPVNWASPNATCAVYLPGKESEQRTDRRLYAYAAGC